MNHLIEKGDNLYQISKKYDVSIDDIIKNNQYLNPYNLKIGTYIKIPINNQEGPYNLKEEMRKTWEQHVFWTRLLIVSIIEHLKDEPETTERLLRNATDLSNLYKPYYGSSIAKIISDLITEHLVIADKLVHAIINKNDGEAKNLNIEWYKNADKISEALSGINPYYDKNELRKMLYTHLDLTKEEVTDRINHNYKKEIETFDNVEKEAIMMADYFNNGINKQFNK